MAEQQLKKLKQELEEKKKTLENKKNLYEEYNSRLMQERSLLNLYI